MRYMHAVFYFGWPGQGFKGLGTTDDKARDLIDVLIEQGEAAPGVRYDSQKFSVVPVPVNAAQVGGAIIPLRESAAVAT